MWFLLLRKSVPAEGILLNFKFPGEGRDFDQLDSDAHPHINQPSMARWCVLDSSNRGHLAARYRAVIHRVTFPFMSQGATTVGRIFRITVPSFVGCLGQTPTWRLASNFQCLINRNWCRKSNS